MTLRIALLGARSQLAAAIAHECGGRHEVAAFDRAALDVTDAAAVDRTLSRVRPDAIVNCASYNFVDAAEDNPVEALGVNALAVRTLARAASRLGAALVHFGTDFVFDGEATRPYREEDAPNPRSVYAASKLLGEWFAFDAPRAYVLRVESLFGRVPGGPPPRGAVETIVQALRAGRTARVFSDRTVSPTSVLDAARATRLLIEGAADPGLYHCVNSGTCTWVDFARFAADVLGVEPRLEVMTLAEAGLRAARPRYCALANDKLRAAGIPMPSWQDSLRAYLEELRREEGRDQPPTTLA